MDLVYLRMDIVNENISLSELTHIENLSARSTNVCEWNGLIDLITILEYYWENNDFLSLKNCGRKSNTELIELCCKYESFKSKPIQEIIGNSLGKRIDTLSIRQKKVLNNLIESQAAGLSVRSFNAINNYSCSNISMQGLKEIILEPKFELSKIRNIGKKSVHELFNFFLEIREQIEIIKLFENDHELTVELFNTYLRRKFCLNSDEIVQIWSNYNYQDGLPIFKTIDTLTLYGHLFNEKEQDIFKRGFKFWTDTEPETLEDIATSIGLTRERTRQIRKKLLDEIDSGFTFLRSLEFDALNLYGIDTDSEYIVIDENLIDEIHQKESVKYNNIFVTKILSLLLNKTHCLVGNIESCAFNIIAKPKGLAYRWNSIYLISKEIDNIFDFESLAIDINRRLSDRIDEDYSFHFETYLVSFLKEGFETDSFLVTQIAEHIIFNEFEITIDLHDTVTFKRNTVKQVYEYSREALEALGEPSKVEEIYNKVKELYPGYNTDVNSIRASMQRKTGFVPFGRTSVYGLKSWEEEKDIRGGTIRDITEEYLISQDEPKHIDDIALYVNKYRSTTAKNIYSNLQMEVNSRFSFFRGMFIGLKSKKYCSLKLEKVETENYERKTWEENYENLFSFTEKYGRLPLASGIGDEKRLYRFFNVQNNRLRNDALSEEKVSNILSLKEKYPTQRKRRTYSTVRVQQYFDNKQSQDRNSISERWWASFDNLKEYIEKNNSYPTAAVNRTLYTFCYNCSKKIENEELSEEQRDALNSINFSFTTGNQNTWWNNFESLKDFLSNEHRYPTTSDKKLYTFCYTCQKKLDDGGLSSEQEAALKDIDFSFKAGNQYTWEDNFNELKLFNLNNNGWPKYIKTDKVQVRLYRFCTSIFKAYKFNELTEEQLAILDNIWFPYKNGAFINVWMNNFEKLKEFRLKNPNSWPKARGGELEKPLYQFCYRNRNKFIDGTLEDYKIQLLNEINFDFYG
jgi:hypothetical protein